MVICQYVQGVGTFFFVAKIIEKMFRNKNFIPVTKNLFQQNTNEPVH